MRLMDTSEKKRFRHGNFELYLHYVCCSSAVLTAKLELQHSVCVRVLYDYEDVVLVRSYHYFVLLAAQTQKGERICLIQGSHDAICLQTEQRSDGLQ
jgi:hypothetical protein